MQFRLIHVFMLAALAALALAAAAATLPALSPVGPSSASAQTANRQFEGRVLSVNRSTRSFRIRDERGTVRIYVRSSTRFHRLSGFGAVRAGRQVEVLARRSGGRWIATRIEPRESGGRGRGSDD